MDYLEKIAFQQAVKEELQHRYNEIQKEANIKAIQKWLVTQLGGQMRSTNLEKALKALAMVGGGAGLYALGKHQGKEEYEPYVPDYLKDASFNKEASVLPWLIPLLGLGGYAAYKASKPEGLFHNYYKAVNAPAQPKSPLVDSLSGYQSY